jgi:classical protein kinase C
LIVSATQAQPPANPGGAGGAADYGSKLASLHARIQKERKILEGFQAMRNATQNQDVIRTCDAKIREAQRTIGWFEESVRELEGRRAAAVGGGRSSPAAAEDPRNRPLPSRPPPPPGAAPSYVQPQAYGASPAMHGRVEARDAASAGGPGGAALFGGAKAKEQFTNLGAPFASQSPLASSQRLLTARCFNPDLIKADTPLTTAKISRMLHQLEFKLHVERQYKEGIDKMAKLYMADGDRKARYVSTIALLVTR